MLHNAHTKKVGFYVAVSCDRYAELEREGGRQTDRQTDRERERERERASSYFLLTTIKLSPLNSSHTQLFWKQYTCGNK